jgi:hypothetical protein
VRLPDPLPAQKGEFLHCFELGLKVWNSRSHERLTLSLRCVLGRRYAKKLSA